MYDGGRRVRGTALTLFGKANDTGYPRLGITVTRKVGNAVRRNRVKRLFREIFRHRRADWPVGLDVVVNAHPGIDYLDRDTIEKDFIRTMQRLVRGVAP